MSYNATCSHIRELSATEVDRLHERLSQSWQVQERYWYPLFPERPSHVEAFQDHYFETEFGYERLRKILTDRNIGIVYELREDARGFEIPVAELEPYYTGEEGFWLSETLDWLIYASHESSLTIGGEWLVSAVCEAWPSWRQRLWTSPFYSRE